MTALTIVLFGIFGLAVGSFLNVVIVRVPSKESLLHPPSKCPLCETPIARRDNIPVISWVLLRGRCRSCGEEIPVGYPLVELGNAVLWAVAAARFHRVGEAVVFALFFSVLLALSVIDLELSILPDALTLPTVLVSLVAVVGLSFAYHAHPLRTIVHALIGCVFFAVFLFLPSFLLELLRGKEMMGFGDIKLALSLGLWAGYLTPRTVPVLGLYSLIAASIVGALVGVIYRLVRKEWNAFPFGPWLAIGTVIVLLAANPIISATNPG